MTCLTESERAMIDGLKVMLSRASIPRIGCIQAVFEFNGNKNDRLGINIGIGESGDADVEATEDDLKYLRFAANSIPQLHAIIERLAAHLTTEQHLAEISNQLDRDEFKRQIETVTAERDRLAKENWQLSEQVRQNAEAARESYDLIMKLDEKFFGGAMKALAEQEAARAALAGGGVEGGGT